MSSSYSSDDDCSNSDYNDVDHLEEQVIISSISTAAHFAHPLEPLKHYTIF